MRNHHEKARDVARSALPSSRRATARSSKALVHRRERAQVRALLHEVATSLDLDDVEADLRHELREDIKVVASIRRGYDKLAPLFRWADHHAAAPALADATPAELVDHLASRLPDDLAGRHAVSHLRWRYELEPDWLRRLGVEPDPVDPPSTWVRPLVEHLVRHGLHGELNRRIRSSLPAGTRTDPRVPPPRYLRGAHDIDAFSAEADHLTRRQVVLVHRDHRDPGGSTSPAR